MNIEEELLMAADIAREAGETVLSYSGSGRMGARAKGDRDVVTLADTSSEELIVDRLRRQFPGDGVVAEEGSQRESASSRTWYIDPLDGTLNYSRDLPIWCVTISLFEDGQPILGVIHDPLRHETFTAARNRQVELNGSPVRPREISSLDSAFVHLTIDFNEESLWDGLDDIRALAPRVLRTRNIGSAALALAYVAAGRFDAMVHRFANPWDYGAGVLMVREVGGHVTEVGGAPYTVDSVALVAAANPAIHRQVLEVLQRPAHASVE